MATRSDFTPEEWMVLRFAMQDTMTWISMVDPKFFASFKEATAGAKYLANAAKNSPSLLVRDLAQDVHSKQDEELKAAGLNLEEPTLERITNAVALVAEKAPEDLDGFKAFIGGLADAAAEASGGVTDSESAALFKVKSALG
jgi:hypothetical protein